MAASLRRPIPIPMMDGFGPEYWTGTQATSRPWTPGCFDFSLWRTRWSAGCRNKEAAAAAHSGAAAAVRAIRLALTDLDFDLPRRCLLLLG
jgi:hypothetical protein